MRDQNRPKRTLFNKEVFITLLINFLGTRASALLLLLSYFILFIYLMFFFFGGGVVFVKVEMKLSAKYEGRNASKLIGDSSVLAFGSAMFATNQNFFRFHLGSLCQQNVVLHGSTN